MKRNQPIINRYVRQGDKFVVNGVAVSPAVWRKCEQCGVRIVYGTTERKLRALLIAIAANRGRFAAAAKNTAAETPAAFRARLTAAKTAAESANVAVWAARCDAAAPNAELKELRKQLAAKRRDWKIDEIAEKNGVSREIAEQIMVERETAAAAAKAARKAARDAERAILSAAAAAAMRGAAAPAPTND